LYQAGTSAEIGFFNADFYALGLKHDICQSGHSETVCKFAMRPCQPLVFLHRQQHVRWLSAVGDDYRPLLRSFFCAANVLIELAARQTCDRHEISKKRFVET
jgi:hypothetical protein